MYPSSRLASHDFPPTSHPPMGSPSRLPGSGEATRGRAGVHPPCQQAALYCFPLLIKEALNQPRAIVVAGAGGGQQGGGSTGRWVTTHSLPPRGPRRTRPLQMERRGEFPNFTNFPPSPSPGPRVSQLPREERNWVHLRQGGRPSLGPPFHPLTWTQPCPAGRGRWWAPGPGGAQWVSQLPCLHRDPSASGAGANEVPRDTGGCALALPLGLLGWLGRRGLAADTGVGGAPGQSRAGLLSGPQQTSEAPSHSAQLLSKTHKSAGRNVRMRVSA